MSAEVTINYSGFALFTAIEILTYVIAFFIGLYKLRPTKVLSFSIGWLLYESIWVPLWVPIMYSLSGRDQDAWEYLGYLFPIIWIWCRASALVGCRFLMRLCPMDPIVGGQAMHANAYSFIRFCVSCSFVLHFLFGIFYLFWPESSGSLAIMCFVLGCHSKLLFRYYDLKMFRGNCILFLRRFNGFADKSLVLSLLRSAPRGVPVAFVVSHENDMELWDPLTIGLAGFRWWRGLESMPLFFALPHDDWQNAINTRIKEATAIVIDASDNSESMAYEISTIGNHAQDKNTIVFIEVTSQALREQISLPWTTKNITTYKKSWSRYFPRALSLFFLTLMLALLFLGIAVGMSNKVGGFRLYGIAPVLLCTVVALVFFVATARPVVSSDAEQELRSFLLAVCKRPVTRPAPGSQAPEAPQRTS